MPTLAASTKYEGIQRAIHSASLFFSFLLLSLSVLLSTCHLVCGTDKMSLNIRGNSRNTGRDNNRQHGDSQGHRGPDLRSLVSKLGRRGSSNKEGNNNNTINTASPSASWWAATASGSPNSKPCNTSTPPTITRGRPISYSSDNNSYYYPHPPPPPAQQPAITSAPRPSAPIAHRPGSWEFPPSPASSSLLLWGGGGSSSQSGQGGRVISDAGSRSSYYSNSGGSSNVDNTSTSR